MIRIQIKDRAGRSREIEAEAGISLMEAIRDAGFDEMLALCGGCCSCATCHVHVVSEFADKVKPMSDDEDNLLASSDARDQTSRLSCQIPLSNALDGMTVQIAEEG